MKQPGYPEDAFGINLPEGSIASNASVPINKISVVGKQGRFSYEDSIADEPSKENLLREVVVDQFVELTGLSRGMLHFDWSLKRYVTFSRSRTFFNNVSFINKVI